MKLLSKTLFASTCLSLLLWGCSGLNRDNPIDEEGKNWNPPALLNVQVANSRSHFVEIKAVVDKPVSLEVKFGLATDSLLTQKVDLKPETTDLNFFIENLQPGQSYLAFITPKDSDGRMGNVASLTFSTGRSQAPIFSGHTDSGFVNGAPAVSRFKQPKALLLDPLGRILLADTGNHAVRALDRGGNSLTLAGTGVEGKLDGTAASATLSNPAGLAFLASGALLISDSGNHKIRVLNPAGTLITSFAGIGRAGFVEGKISECRFNNPTGLAFDADTLNIYVADTGNARIRTIFTDGTISTIAGNGQFGRRDGLDSIIGYVQYLEFSKGKLYFTDTTNGRVCVYESGTGVKTISGKTVPSTASINKLGFITGSDLSSRYGEVLGLKIRGENLFVSDRTGQHIRKIDLTNQESVIFAGERPDKEDLGTIRLDSLSGYTVTNSSGGTESTTTGSSESAAATPEATATPTIILKTSFPKKINAQLVTGSPFEGISALEFLEDGRALALSGNHLVVVSP